MDLLRFSQQLDFITEIDKLKQVVRETWLVDASRKETDAEHSWHIAVMALLLGEYAKKRDIDLFKVVKMLLIHDIVEIDAGDTFFYDKRNTKGRTERERTAANRIFGLLPDQQKEEFTSLWEEFEAMSTVEAQFARALDMFQPLLLAYLNGGCSWKIHNIIKPQILKAKIPIGIGSQHLWEYTQELLDKAVAKGILKEK